MGGKSLGPVPISGLGEGSESDPAKALGHGYGPTSPGPASSFVVPPHPRETALWNFMVRQLNQKKMKAPTVE